MQIGELARQAGVNIQTIRFYERSRLLPAPDRKPSGYRDYDQQDLRRLQFILQAKALGFSLKEIRDILEMRKRGQCSCTDVIRIAERHYREVQLQIQRLERYKHELAAALKKWKRTKEPKLSADSICVLIERTMEEVETGR